MGLLRLTAPVALATALLVAAPATPVSAARPAARPSAPASPGADDVAGLQARLDAAAARAQALADALEQQAARDSGLRTRLAQLAEQQDAARAAVDVRARQAFLASSGGEVPGPLGRLVLSFASPELHGFADGELARRAEGASVRVAQQLVDAVQQHSAAAAALRDEATAYRAQLQQQADAALAAQDDARRLLADAEAAVAAEQERQQVAATAAALAALQAQLAAVRTRLDTASATVTTALAPATTARGRGAAQREAAVLALVEAAGAGYPAGYRPTGQVLSGQASWYGPGFVGSPTASGAPYDPERLTCAHKSLPLGTVVRVTSGSRSVSCLVDDRGPYVDGRILDMSRAGARALGYDGVADVVVEVLAPPG